MKKRKGVMIKIHLTNRWLYTLIAIGILALVGVGVYAATYGASGAGHPITEISTCGANQVLKMNAAGDAWTCVAETSIDTRCDTTNCGQLRTTSTALVTNLNADMVDGRSVSTAFYQCPSVSGSGGCSSTCNGQITTSSTCSVGTYVSYLYSCYGTSRDCTLLGYLVR